MLKNIFDSEEESIITQRPDPELLAAIREHNNRIDRVAKYAKMAGLLFAVVMAVLWFGSDFAGCSPDVTLLFGLLTIFGFPLIWGLGAFWVSRPSVKRNSRTLAESALAQLNLPDDVVELEMLFPKKIKDDFANEKKQRFENGMQLAYSDHEALYLVNLSGIVRIPYSRMGSWTESDKKARVRNWVQDSPYTAYAKSGVKKKRYLISLIPVLGSFVPDDYEIPYAYSVLRTETADYLLCVPTYEMEKLRNLRR